MSATYVRRSLLDLAAYTPGEQPENERVIKLNTNENPYPPSPRVMEAIKATAPAEIRRYPDPSAQRVRARAAARYEIAPDHIVVGNGSDELLNLVMRACVDPGARVAYAVPTYSLYDALVAAQGGCAIRIPFGASWALPSNLARTGAKVIVVCHPNSPSGTGVPREQIEALARAAPGLVLVDEAYADFADETALPLVRRCPNVAVLRTFSKSFSLAGMRIGLGFGPPDLIAVLVRIKDSYNVNRLSLLAAAAALDDYEWMKANVARVLVTRASLANALTALDFEVTPSQANFVFARRPGTDLAPLKDALRTRGILVRHFPTPELRDGLRITVGTDAEVDTLLRELRALRR